MILWYFTECYICLIRKTALQLILLLLYQCVYVHIRYWYLVVQSGPVILIHLCCTKFSCLNIMILCKVTISSFIEHFLCVQLYWHPHLMQFQYGDREVPFTGEMVPTLTTNSLGSLHVWSHRHDNPVAYSSDRALKWWQLLKDSTSFTNPDIKYTCIDVVKIHYKLSHKCP